MTFERSHFFPLPIVVDRVLQEVLHPLEVLHPDQESIRMNLADQEHAYLVRASLPGVHPDDVQIQVTGTTLTIRGEVKAEMEYQEGQWLRREHQATSYYRSITLPGPVDADTAQATYEHGMLTLTLPKAEEAKPKQIKVQAPPSVQAVPSTTTEEVVKDQVTEASKESFPASDASASTMTTATSSNPSA